jgi:hypothetical protein
MCTVLLPPGVYPIAAKCIIFYVLFLSIVLFYELFVCKYVLYYCHRVSTQLKLNISYHHIIIPNAVLKFPWFTVQKHCDVTRDRAANAYVRSWKHDHNFVTFCSWKAGFSTSPSVSLSRRSHLVAFPTQPPPLSAQRRKANVNNQQARRKLAYHDWSYVPLSALGFIRTNWVK